MIKVVRSVVRQDAVAFPDCAGGRERQERCLVSGKGSLARDGAGEASRRAEARGGDDEGRVREASALPNLKPELDTSISGATATVPLLVSFALSLCSS